MTRDDVPLDRIFAVVAAALQESLERHDVGQTFDEGASMVLSSGNSVLTLSARLRIELRPEGGPE